MNNKEEFIIDEVCGERLLISKKADQSELEENLATVKVWKVKTE